ncbi:Gcd10p family-domain-containing protein [Naematelia encephala]|uniref:tRNA (adenine(58)-N(1))-methyltransferase non-catalytic subunit TRM6 n=1 Tax=Naematelia encephala TaxID=71784 RepID=A0A1Y2AF19_9TREE|nr:Gcd10p family-domain-containing protein [Naematelia encephala]
MEIDVPEPDAQNSTNVVPVVSTNAGSEAPALAGPSGNDGSSASTSKPATKQVDKNERLLERVTRIRKGDNVLLRLPSDSIKAVVASTSGLVNLGKFGSFPAEKLIGLHYDITYEIITDTSLSEGVPAGDEEEEEEQGERSFGQGPRNKKKKNNKGKGTPGEGGEKTAAGWRNVLRPLKRRAVLDAVIDDITETNEFIDDDPETAKSALLSQDEIEALRAQGVSAEEMIQKQIARHEQFGLKTDFSKEKWRKRKERKFYQTIHALAPSIHNITTHYLTRNPIAIQQMRSDTLSQLLTISNIRPEGRYLVVDDTGGLVTAGILERMGCEGRLLTFTPADSPPSWAVLNVMNFGEVETDCVRWLSWMEAEEDYQRPPPPPEEILPEIAVTKTQARIRKHNAQVKELNETRAELFTSQWDGLIVASELNPISILTRLVPYLSGSATITVYSPYHQTLAEVLSHGKKDAQLLGCSLTESWTRTYQVLPGRTHPMMTTSATGGYLFYATKVIQSGTVPAATKSRFQQRKSGKRKKPESVKVDQGQGEDQEGEEDEVEDRVDQVDEEEDQVDI